MFSQHAFTVQYAIHHEVINTIMTNETTPAPNFIRNQVRDEIEGGQVTKIVTRFPRSPMAFCISAMRSRSV